MATSKDKKHLVIIGGGFAGLNLAKHIDKAQWSVTIIDRNNYHSFPPLFYQVASSGLEPASISFPFRREMLSRKCRGCEFHLGEADRIDTARREVHTQFETLSYDALVLAAGSTNNFFGIPDLEKKVYTLKSTPEAIRCRNEILDRLERASLCPDRDKRRRLLTFAVVGGGPAGVEIAGALGEFKRYTLKREYPSLDLDDMRVVLIEGTGKLLGTMSEKSSEDALRGLEQLMVDVQLNKKMDSYDDGVLRFADGSTIETDTVVWTAGVRAVSFEMEGTDVQPGHAGRWEVDAYNSIVGIDDVYAIGDIAIMSTVKYPKGHPQVAQVALQQGANLAENLNNPHREARAFEYNDKGSMATIGRNRAVADIGKMHLSGKAAWFAWLVVHLMTLLGMRNRAVVFINWMWSYFTFSAGLRILIRPEKYPLRKYWKE
ncbi:MAG: NAD(P)/FAD-dependent oxidoreductase [Bacteroidales bacterium]|nr:NAD(P)/FAD-dependent oxidoreductase [Bacteroidales bacterium]